MFRQSFVGSYLRFGIRFLVLVVAALVMSQWLPGQTCSTGDDVNPATRSAIDNTAKQFLDMSKKGDVAGLKANAISAITADFGAIEQAVVTNKPYLGQGPAAITGTYLLDASQAKVTLERADFYCGIYNSPHRLVFSIPNLPPGLYAVVLQKVEGKDPITLTLILQNVAGVWKLAGYYPRLDSIGGHDGSWYLAKAREFKSKGQLHNAWFYYLTTWDLTAPVPFMSTPQLDKLSDEMESARPRDLPSDSSPLSLPAGSKIFKVTEITPIPADNDLDLRIRYENSEAGNSGLASQDNMAVIKAVLARYPELRDGFTAVVARAIDSSGHEYGSLLPVKDVK